MKKTTSLVLCVNFFKDRYILRQPLLVFWVFNNYFNLIDCCWIFKQVYNIVLPLTPKVPFINIIMIGVTGSGKSSVLGTFATALTNSDCDYIRDIYRTCPLKSREKSATKKVMYCKFKHYCVFKLQIRNLKFIC